jgi:type IV pilus assembly protein PilN
MQEINLLPWREQRREELRKQFFIMLAASALLASVAVGGYWFVMNTAIDGQKARNSYVNAEIQLLEKQVREIKGLKKRKKQMLERMKVIQDLQGRRPVVVRVFDEIARLVPRGVFFGELTRTGDAFNLSGVAQSNNRVASLMRNIDKSDWFKGPNLRKVTANRSYGPQANNFVLSFKLDASKQDELNKPK